MKNLITETITLLTAALMIVVFQGCSQFETPLQIPAMGTIQVITTPEAKCTLYLADKPVMEWTGSRIIPGLLAGNYKVKIISDKYNSIFQQSFQLGVSERKNLETSIGILDIRIKSNFVWELSKNNKLILSGEGSLRIDTLWTGAYKLKVVVPGVANNFIRDISITKAQTYLLEMNYGSLDVRLPSSMEATLLNGSTELTQWNGSKVIDSLWVGNYNLKIKVNPMLPEYETSFTIAKGKTEVIELEYGSLDVKVQNQMECVLFRESIEIERWLGSRKYDSLWVGDYAIKIKVNPLLPDYGANFTITNQQTKLVEPLLGSISIKTKSDYQNSLFLDGVIQISWNGTKEFDPWITGNYSLKTKMFPGAPAIVKNFILQQNESKIIEWDYGRIDIDVLPVATFKLKREGVNQLTGQGSGTLDSIITGNYSFEIQEPNSPFWTENFTLNKDAQKSIAIPYSALEVITNVTSSTTKLIYNGSVVKSINGNGTIVAIVPGNYTLIVEAIGYYSKSENIVLLNGQTMQKNIQLTVFIFEMVTIPSGIFIMGCTSEQTNCVFDELPTHQVTLSAYSIGKYEITQKQWYEVMGTNPSHFTGDNRPVEQVTWYEAINFCNILSVQQGLSPVYTVNGINVSCNFQANGYRLPTEAEWEYAARGGVLSTSTLYSGSYTIGDVAWYVSNSGSSTHDVGTKQPNQLGLYDMSGNVWEWCWDWYGGGYTSGSQINPVGATTGTGRMDRGGSWYDTTTYCRVSFRGSITPSHRGYNVGFRVVRTM